jgi:hypothetical protein
MSRCPLPDSVGSRLTLRRYADRHAPHGDLAEVRRAARR